MSNPTPDTHDAAAKEERSSGYARLPKIARDEASKALDVAEHAAERLAEGTKDAARHLGRDVGRGLRAASHAFDEPAGTKIEGLISEANLPALAGDDPLAELAARLDREGDLWRNLALRELARHAWAGRLAQIVAVVAVLGDAALACIAAMGALFGGEHAHEKLALILGGVASLTVGAIVVAWVSASSQRTQRAVAAEALARADVVELRLHRIGVALAARKIDPERARESLARLERDVGG